MRSYLIEFYDKPSIYIPRGIMYTFEGQNAFTIVDGENTRLFFMDKIKSIKVGECVGR